MIGDDAQGVCVSTAGQFATTHWSVVLAARNTESPQAGQALEQLCRAYWYPLYVYVRRQGHSPEDAQDLTQEFFARFIAKEYLRKTDQSKGRFRSFLLAALKHFLADQWDRAHAQKRGGQIHFVPVDYQDAERRYREEPMTELSPDKLYAQRWASVLLEQVMAHLERDFVESGKGELFLTLRPMLIGDSDMETYAELGAQFGLSEAAIKMKAQRLRHRYLALLRLEIAQTVENPDEVEEEIRYLFSILRG